MDSKIRLRLSAFAERLYGPLGSVPLDRAIRADLDLFQTLRESGATWPQIANALAAVGARRPDGSLIGADHVRSAVTRQLKRTATTEVQLAPPTPSDRHQKPSRMPKRMPDVDDEINSDDQLSGERTEIRPKRAEEPGKDFTRALAAEPPSGQRNQSILEKLARTRKLRES